MITTRTGRVVYNRPIHFFTLRDLRRIFFRVLPNAAFNELLAALLEMVKAAITKNWAGLAKKVEKETLKYFIESILSILRGILNIKVKIVYYDDFDKEKDHFEV